MCEFQNSSGDTLERMHIVLTEGNFHSKSKKTDIPEASPPVEVPKYAPAKHRKRTDNGGKEKLGVTEIGKDMQYKVIDDTEVANPLLLRTSKGMREVIRNYKKAKFSYRVDRAYMSDMDAHQRRATMLRDLLAKSLQYTLVSIDVSHFPLDWPTLNHNPIGQINNSLEAILANNCTALKELTLVDTGIYAWNELGTALYQCTALERLHISSGPKRTTPVASPTFYTVFTAIGGRNMPNLTDIDFSDCGLADVSDFLAKDMPTYSALTKLNLSGNLLHTWNWDYNDVIRALPQCHRLQHVDLSNNKIGVLSCEALVFALPLCTCLTHLDLSDNCLNVEFFRRLAPMLSRCTTLRSLSLRNNPWGIGPSLYGLVHHGELSRLTYLDVSGCGFDCYEDRDIDDGLTPRQLGLCTNLTQLSLAHNKLGDDFTHILLGSVLPTCTALTHLDLAATKITDDGVRGLAPLLSRCPTLIRLNLMDNRLGAGTKARIQTSWNAVHAGQRDGLWM